LKVSSAVINLYKSYASEKTARDGCDIFIHELESIVVYNLSDCIKNEGVLKVTASHVHYKSGDISETVQDRDVVTTDH